MDLQLRYSTDSPSQRHYGFVKNLTLKCGVTSRRQFSSSLN
jgi:hypothetical protein